VTTERFHPEALDELEGAGLFYKAESNELARSFAEEVRAAIDWALEFPMLGSPIDSRYRRAFVKRFPYAVIYRLEADVLYILAVAHLRRKPGYWRTRV
jgi:toxin ParE1/3/4